MTNENKKTKKEKVKKHEDIYVHIKKKSVSSFLATMCVAFIILFVITAFYAFDKIKGIGGTFGLTSFCVAALFFVLYLGYEE